MTSTPPDPGHAITAAKNNAHDAATGAFITTAGLRYLYPENGAWILTSAVERTVSLDTYNKLRGSTEQARGKFKSGEAWYALADEGVCATAIPA